MKRIAILLRTNGLEYDARVRKIALSIKKTTDCELTILAFVRNAHTKTGITAYGIPYENIFFPELWISQNKYKKHYALFRLFCSVRRKLKPFDILWLENEVMQYVALFTLKPVIWDLREIPLRYRFGFGRKLFHLLEKKCKAISHANQYRIEYLIDNGVVKQLEKHFVLHNYVDNQWKSFDGPIPESFKKFSVWLDGEQYVYLQGLSSVRRYPYETMASVLKSGIPKIVLVGGLFPKAEKQLDVAFPGWRSRVYQMGMLPHDELKWLTKGSVFSLVFYIYDHPNNRFCEPNRLYQSLSLGVPVIVGKNEPLSDFVSASEFPGVVLESDGRNIEENLGAIHRLLQDYESFKKKADGFRGVLCWEYQDAVIKKMLGKVKSLN